MNASYRLNTCKSRGSAVVAILLAATGALVSNTYATCPGQGDNTVKTVLIPHKTTKRHLFEVKEIRFGVSSRPIR